MLRHLFASQLKGGVTVKGKGEGGKEGVPFRGGEGVGGKKGTYEAIHERNEGVNKGEVTMRWSHACL